MEDPYKNGVIDPREEPITTIRRSLGFLFLLAGLASLAAFAASFLPSRMGEAGRVSQVFERLQAYPAGPGNSLLVYDVAVTPVAPDRTAVLCKALTFSPDRSENLLERRVWILPTDPVWAYHENAHARRLGLVLLGFGVVLTVLAFPLFRSDE